MFMRRTSKKLLFFQHVHHQLLVFSMCLISVQLSSASKTTNSIFPGQFLSGNNTIVSQGGVFEMGFFTPGQSRNYYVGIWYKGLTADKTVVWVANRNKPVSDPFSSSIQLLEDGNLVLTVTKTKLKVWSTNTYSAAVHNSTLDLLLDNGNFILRERRDSSKVLWQSFDHPTDTWLPGAKLGYRNFDKKTIFLTSWKSSENPASGSFSLQLEQNGTGIILVWNGEKVYWNSGDWTGQIFRFVPEIILQRFMENFIHVSNKNESYFIFSNSNLGMLRFVMDYTGQLKNYIWGKNFKQWNMCWMRPTQQCDVYSFCGAFSDGNQMNAPLCECIQGFEPRMLQDWELGDHSGGCLRKFPIDCNDEEKSKFVVISSTRFPLNSESLAVENDEVCESSCLRNCSCSAYAYDIGVCLIWKGDLINFRQLSSEHEVGKNIHIRIAASDDDHQVSGIRNKIKISFIVTGSMILFFTFLVLVFVFIWRYRRCSSTAFEAVGGDTLVVFKYGDLLKATKNFTQKLGEGGFGSVFRGSLPNSTDIAVKKLRNISRNQKQFRAEVSTIGMIHHTNIVRLVGFCAEGSRRLLVYDYIARGSLETHLFRKGSKILDWKTRYQIAVGVARGLAYLHEECRECIIHCNIKPENILLDSDYNPKVADFGLAKLVDSDFSRVITTLRGTRGYLAPEWISGEAVTTKVDVYSYGKVLFEIISGRRNIDTVEDGMQNYFPALVANAVNKGEEVLFLLDQRLEGNANVEELSRACKTACWCIQDNEKERPTMGQVVQLLEGLIDFGMPPIPRYLRIVTEGKTT